MHACRCGKSFGTAKGLLQHRTRYCKAATSLREDSLPAVAEDPPDSSTPAPDSTTSDGDDDSTSTTSTQAGWSLEDEDFLHTCVCGSKYKALAHLRQHQRRYCQVFQTGQPQSTICAVCDREFKSYAGRRQHERLAHGATYNAELEAETAESRTAFSQLEILHLAQAELAFKGRFVNQHLAKKFNRGDTEIKNQRRKDTYKALLEQLKRDQEAADSDASSEGDVTVNATVINTETTNELSGRTPPLPLAESSILHQSIHIESLIDSPMLNSTALRTNTTLRQRTSFVVADDDPVRPYLRNLMVDAEDEEEKTLIRAALQEELTQVHLDRWVDGIIDLIPGKKIPKMPANRINGIQPTRSQKYRACQRLYERNRAQLADVIIDDKPLTGACEQPSAASVTALYEQVFATTSKADPYVPIIGKNVGTVYRHISKEEIVDAIATSRSASAGPDGVMLGHLRPLVDKLTILYNIMLFTTMTPTTFRTSRTVLIPKGTNNLTDANNWRPITIGCIMPRVMHRILAQRLSAVPIKDNQHGFVAMDGCITNSLALHQIIEQHRQSAKPFSIISLDLRKAFDLVSRESVVRAVSNAGVHNKIVRYLSNSYADNTTHISCNGVACGSVDVRRGVKQGDPMSPILFNIVMDELLHSLPDDLGLPLTPVRKIAGLAFADDLLLLSPDTYTAQHLLTTCKNFFDKRGMELNPKKCVSICTKVVPARKKLAAMTTARFYVGAERIKALGLEEARYLGHRFSVKGTSVPKIADLFTGLTRISRAPLQAYQKCRLIIDYLIPRFIFSLQNPTITAALLGRVDQAIRKTVKNILALPTTTADAFLYAPVKWGGLGIPHVSELVPRTMLNRITKLQLTGDEIARGVHQNSNHLTRRLLRMLGDHPTSKEAGKTKWAASLENSYAGGGRGINDCRHHASCSAWLLKPPRNWSNTTYKRAIKLRGNYLPTRGIPSNPPEERLCRTGCGRTESLSHVLQTCPVTHLQRIKRHDRVVELTRKFAVKKGWTVEVEPHIRQANGVLRKPDLVLTKANRTVVCDVQIGWGGSIQPLTSSYQHKQEYYNTPEFVSAMQRRRPANTVIEFMPLIVGARGTWCFRNSSIVELLGLARNDIAKLVEDVVLGGIMIHTHFNRATWM